MRSIATTAQNCVPWYSKFDRVGRSVDSHHRAEMLPMGNKTCQVSESFGSSSVASLRTPPTWFHRARACAGENDFTSSDRRPIRPQRPPEHPPEHPPLRDHTRLPPNPHRIGICQAKCRNRLSNSSVVVHGGNSRSIRQVIPTATEAFSEGAPSKDNPFAARRPLTHGRTFSRFRGSY